MQVAHFIRLQAIAVFFSVTFMLNGCADLRNASAADIRQMVTLKTDDHSPYQFWVAPELQVRRYRLQFAGYDTIYYYLYNVKPTPDVAAMHVRVHIDANYGGVVRHYDQAKFPDGFVSQTVNLEHNLVRCQLFGNMVDACLFRDRGEIELSQAELEVGRINGLTLALSSANAKDYEVIDLPAAYIDGFLQALPNP